MMKSKWWLAVALMCLLPASLSAGITKKGCDQWWNWWDQNCKQPQPPPHQSQSMPEGGSPSVYLLGAGATCLGAIYLRRRISKTSA